MYASRNLVQCITLRCRRSSFHSNFTKTRQYMTATLQQQQQQQHHQLCAYNSAAMQRTAVQASRARKQFCVYNNSNRLSSNNSSANIGLTLRAPTLQHRWLLTADSMRCQPCTSNSNLKSNFTSQLTFPTAHSVLFVTKRGDFLQKNCEFYSQHCKYSTHSALQNSAVFLAIKLNAFTRPSQRYSTQKNLSENMAPQLAPTVKLNNGYEMPVLGLGTYESVNNDAEIAVKHAIDVGYRHIDTAYFYKNEAEIGSAIKAKIDEGVVKREDLFIVTKLWNIYHDPERVEGACRKQLALLGLDYIDLYLMHLPVGYKYVDEETLLPKNEAGVLQLSDVDYVDTYKAMEKLVDLGLVRSIGISNFNSEQIKRVLEICRIKPVTNQVECSPALNQKQLIKFCQAHDITLTAYSPLGRPKPAAQTPAFYFSPQTKAIADKYKKTPAQVVIRYLLDIGAIPIPKSSNPKRIEENFNVFDFQLSPEEIAVMDGFNTGERLVPFNLIKAQNHKYWPFAIEY